MTSSKLDLERLHWQLELIAEIDPGTVGEALQEHCDLKADLHQQPNDIVTHFLYRCFDGFGEFLGQVERQFRDAHSPLGILEEYVLAEWRELASKGDEELMGSAVETGLFVEFSHKDRLLLTNRNNKAEAHRQLFNPFDLHGIGRAAASGVERDYLLKKIVGQLARSGPYRRFTFNEDTMAKLCQLKQASPSFAVVTDRIIDAVFVATKYTRPIKMTPILLVGEAGIGKSYYAGQLAQCLGVPIKPIAMDNLQEGSALAGSSFIYSNSQPGEVFKVMTENDHLSPLVVLEEVDKARVSDHGDTLGPLHNLLEPVSAKQFRDGSVGLPVDASHVIWIATANSLGRIPKTLQSRFEIIEIPSQSQDVKRTILAGICDELIAEYNDITFSDEVLDALVDTNPREQRQLLERALSRTVRLGEELVTFNHLNQVAPQLKQEPVPEPGRPDSEFGIIDNI